eukprot:CAMPEP_0183721078 /NCGR_PEP_ID=MMETSP0737-20130205/13492_1 /TAXON_ID=385413 /ORGANISM="Thalassiosira miniscula, Strain CCMP1093" /LENGTH=828 /DNA_ID=CAMNT_0025951047 /DNA_START=265 /DNA_END=2751 /DNA_ORIENTATION=-
METWSDSNDADHPDWPKGWEECHIGDIIAPDQEEAEIQFPFSSYNVPILLNNSPGRASGAASHSSGARTTTSQEVSRASPTQRLALEQYLVAPSPEGWQSLVESMKADRRLSRRRQSRSRSRSRSQSRNRSRSRDSSVSSPVPPLAMISIAEIEEDAKKTSDGSGSENCGNVNNDDDFSSSCEDIGDLHYLPASVEIPTSFPSSPHRTGREDLEIIEEGTDEDASLIPAAQILLELQEAEEEASIRQKQKALLDASVAASENSGNTLYLEDVSPDTSPSVTNGTLDSMEAMEANINATIQANEVPNVTKNELLSDANPVKCTDDTPHPWWKNHYGKCMIIALGFIICVTVSMALTIGLGTTSNDASVTFLQQQQSLRPSASTRPSHAPSLRPSTLPSSSSLPSVYLPSLSWEQVGSAAVGESSEDLLGWSSALSSDGTVLAVGAPGSFDGNKRRQRPGYVQVFQRSSRNDELSSWEQLGANLEGTSEGDLFGQTLALSANGKVLAIGAPGHPAGLRPGYVRVYSYTKNDFIGSGWKQLGHDIAGETNGDMFGASVSLDAVGMTLAIGSNGRGHNSGDVKVYRINDVGTSLSWIQIGQVIDVKAANDNLGKSVKLSADGMVLAIGSLYNDANGLNSGHARVYTMEEEESGQGWKQVGQDIDGMAASNWSGVSVSLSSEGRTLAIGVNGSDRNGENLGEVKVYRLEAVYGNGPRWEQLGQDIDGEVADDRSGIDVALSSDGTTLAVGANGISSNGVSSGHVKVYRTDDNWLGERWKQLGQVITGEAAGDNFGFSISVAADGRTVAVGSPWDDTNGHRSGNVRVFKIERSK